MKPYFLPLLLLPILSGCSNASGTKAATTADSARPGTSAQAASTPDSLSGEQPKPPKEDTAALNLRLALESTLSANQTNISIPPFGLDKVMADIRRMKFVDDPNGGDDFSIALSDSIYDSLSFDEKFTYNMIHAEDYSQMCDALPEHADEQNRIYGLTVAFFGEYSWSKRQLSFFNDNRDSIEQLMKRVIDRQGRIGMNFLYVIARNNSTDMIPYLIDFDRKDNSNHYVLTTLMLLMKENDCPEFEQSISYKKLYGNEREMTAYAVYLTYNKANEDLIIQRATNFYYNKAQP